jgi:hypothetical protein
MVCISRVSRVGRRNILVLDRLIVQEDEVNPTYVSSKEQAAQDILLKCQNSNNKNGKLHLSIQDQMSTYVQLKRTSIVSDKRKSVKKNCG